MGLSFSLTQKGQIRNQINHLKTQDCFDRGSVKSPSRNVDITLNLDSAGRNMSLGDSMTGYLHKYLSNRKIKFSPMMLLGVTTYRFEIDEVKFNEHLNEVIESLSRKDNRHPNWYEATMIMFAIKVLNDGTFKDDLMEIWDRMGDMANDRGDWNTILMAELMGL